MSPRPLILSALLCVAGVLPVFAQLTYRPIDYIVLEGGGPDQGPGPHMDANMAELKEKLGEVNPISSRMYAYGVQQIRILSRSVAVVAADVNRALDAAEATGMPVWLHVDPYYAWGADTEKNPAEAPAVKFWEHPEMREWGEFPLGDRLPTHIPRLWFNWGPWCTPTSAVPALGAPKFIELARSQLLGGVVEPLVARLSKWRREGRAHLFAGINIGWEDHMPSYPEDWKKIAKENGGQIVAGYPVHLKGLPMDPSIPGMQLGYASLYWRGWTEARLREQAEKEKISRDELFRRLTYGVIHDYMEALAKACFDRGIPADLIYTHIVALATVNEPDTNHPPIWTAVNRYSVPGFTLDNKGAAKYDLTRLVRDIDSAPGSRRAGFGAVETYFALGNNIYVTDAQTYRRELDELFDAGAKVKVVYAAFPFKDGRAPEAAFEAIRGWLQAGSP